MKCEQDYCIYNRDYLCILNEIRLNSLGMCEECNIVAIPENSLKIMKENQLVNLKKTSAKG